MTDLPLLSYAAVFSAILLPGALYFFMAFKERHKILDVADFFPLRRFLSSNEYRSTTVAAGMSLATVIVAFINLAPFLGLTLMVSVVSFSFSFLILYPCVGRILEFNRENDTIQTYLGKAYNSQFVRHIALIFSIIGYVSIFCMEMIVGVTVLEPFLGSRVLIFAIIYLLFILIYSWMSGYRAIIATDKWQLRFIVGSILALLFFGVMQYSPSTMPLKTLLAKGITFPPIWPFIIGITVMNLPAPISDAGTWQRLCSTKNEKEAKKGLIQVIPLFATLWSLLVLFGVFYTPLAQELHNFDPSQSTLMTHIILQMSSNGPVFFGLLFVFFLGLFSAMISTADSLLIVASQILAIDLMKIRPTKGSPKNNLRKARMGMVFLALISFSIFSLFYLVKFDVVQLVFSIYGAQLAMFPSVFATLFLRNNIILSRANWAAGFSILSGFSAGWGSAIYGKLSGNLNWLYNAPVCALVFASVTFIILAFLRARRHE